MMDEKGEKQEDKEKILEIFKKYYEELYSKAEPETEEEKRNEERINNKLERIIEEGRKQKPIIYTWEEVKKITTKLKRKKAKDSRGWNNEMIIEGGEEMVKSITTMCNRIAEENVIPREWEDMVVKTIYKNKGSRMEVGNRRGLFLTSVMSKVYEKAIMTKTEGGIKTSEYQNGGKKERSTKDNWIAIMAAMEGNKERKKDTYILFADAEKCFDKLWLQDCLVDLHGAGMREREVEMIYNMNRKARMTIDTPHGKTKVIEQKEIVKQGTVFGPQLCCVSTDQVNRIGMPPTTMITTTETIEALVFVDDIAAIGGKDTIEQAGSNMRRMEEEKKFTFNVGKTKYIKINTGKRGGKEEEPMVVLKRGKISRIDEYKYLGNWITTKGTAERQIEEMKGKVKGMVREIRNIGKEEEIGKYSTEAQLMMYEKTAVPSLVFNMEVWTRIREGDWEHIEKIQAGALKSILRLPNATPYWGVLKETGIWPLRMKVWYHRLMLYENLMNSCDERLGKKIISRQKEREQENGWYGRTKEIAAELEMDLKEMENMKKQEWKKKVKKKIQNRVERISGMKQEEMRKLRHQKNEKFERQKYLGETTLTEATEMIRMRLEMEDIGNNQGKGRKCECGEEERTEHIVKCKEVKKWMKERISMEMIESNEKKELRKGRKWIEEYLEKREHRGEE